MINDFPDLYKSVIDDPVQTNKLVSKFIDETKSKFTSTIYKYFKNKIDIEEMFYICIAKIIRKIHLYDNTKSGFLTWCYQVISNECLDHIRKQKIKFGGNFIGDRPKFVVKSINILPTSDVDYKHIDPFDNGFINSSLAESDFYTKADFCDNISDKIYINILNTVKNNLSEIEYTVLYDRYYNELSYDEICLKNNYKLGTVKSVLNRLKTKLTKISKELLPEFKIWVD